MSTDLLLNLGGYITLSLIMFSSGLYVGNLRLEALKANVEAVASKQQAKASIINAESESISNVVHQDYLDKLDVIASYYTNSVQPDSCSSTMPKVPNSSSGTNAGSPHNVVAECAKTTLMLTELQKWIKKENDANK